MTNEEREEGIVERGQGALDAVRYASAAAYAVSVPWRATDTTTMEDNERLKQKIEAVERNAGDDDVLLEAHRIGSRRGEEYGSPEPNMAAIAELWSAYIENASEDGSVPVLGPDDAALMMSLVKVARHQTGGPSRDNFVDMAGYARVAADVTGENSDGGSE